MSVEIKYDQDRKLLDVTVSGKYDINEFISAFETITNSSEYPPDVNAIWDIRKTDFSGVNFQLVNKFVEIRSRFTKRGNCRSALIVSSELQFGLSRMFEMLSEGIIPHFVKIFRNYRKGEKWLLEN